MKKEQVAELGQTKQEGAESTTETIIQPELEALHSFEVTPDNKYSHVSFSDETKQEAEIKRIPERKTESQEPRKSFMQDSKAKDARSPVTKTKLQETGNVVKSNDGFWD